MLERVIISGGGTGGHIFPALSIAGEIKRRYPQADILFVGADNRMEMQRVPAAGYPIVGLPVAGFDRKRLWRNFRTLWLLFKSMRKARNTVRDFRPQIAIGVGGYCSGPTLKAAQKLGVPTVIQEQNGYPGVTNKLLAKKAEAICVAYEGTERFFPADRIHMTGNPVRAALLDCRLSPAEAKTQLGFDPQMPLVLVVGGSLGASTINRAIAAGVPAITAAGAQLLWQTGRRDTTLAAEATAGNPQARATEFISEMDVAYRAADIVVSRAGAGSISELQLLGKAAILVPSPNVTEDHQRKNALALVGRDAAIMVEDSAAATDLVPAVTALLADAPRREAMSRAIEGMALRDSAALIVDIIEQTVSNQNK
ncbi:MAG: undecaprenyldiphospho-muramoylpentapeptide beta-N-acetylglucosaminyltransferase [Muribaculaceae bacterium]|nr:undecaprenyldiphospho-muramoylpentapeptide beta-N-acetylglucosaminyltransferase [Muribaculaceae bacterium]